MLTVATTTQSQARAFVSIIQEIANQPLSPEEFEQLKVSDLDTRRNLERSLSAARERLGRFLRYFQRRSDRQSST
jgi:hypothetical protein